MKIGCFWGMQSIMKLDEGKALYTILISTLIKHIFKKGIEGYSSYIKMNEHNL